MALIPEQWKQNCRVTGLTVCGERVEGDGRLDVSSAPTCLPCPYSYSIFSPFPNPPILFCFVFFILSLFWSWSWNSLKCPLPSSSLTALSGRWESLGLRPWFCAHLAGSSAASTSIGLQNWAAMGRPPRAEDFHQSLASGKSEDGEYIQWSCFHQDAKIMNIMKVEA